MEKKTLKKSTPLDTCGSEFVTESISAEGKDAKTPSRTIDDFYKEAHDTFNTSDSTPFGFIWILAGRIPYFLCHLTLGLANSKSTACFLLVRNGSGL